MTMPAGSTISVLIADDDPLVRRVLRLALQSQGYRVVEAADMRGVLEHAREHPDLVVLDVNMPGGTLSETLGGLRQERADVPILVLSGESVAPDDLPVDHADFARKPIELDDLLSRVRRLLHPAASLLP